MEVDPAELEPNSIRRDRIRRIIKKENTDRRRAALPVMTLEEIRQFRMPYHEALLTNLEENNYVITAEYIRQLFRFQQQLREKAGPVSPLLARPQLYLSKNELNYLCDSVMKTEDYHNEENYASECEEMLQLAIHFAFSSEDWWWLGEQLLIQCLSVTKQNKSLDRRYEALGRYAYAKFLLVNLSSDNDAMYQLKVARKLANGQDWTTKLIFPKEVDLLSMKVIYLMHECLIREIETLMKTDNVKAGRLAVIAKKWAAEACYPQGKLPLLCCVAKLGDPKGICEARIHIAKAYLLDGSQNLSLNTLLLLRESAKEFNLPYYLAQAYRHLGEYFLNNGEAPKATSLLAEAFTIFHEGNYIKECDQVRNLRAITTGLGLFPNYLDLLDKTDESREYLMQLVDWKDSRKPFDGAEDIGSLFSVEGVIEKSKMELKEKLEDKKRSVASYQLHSNAKSQETVP
ncbi:hypothetical protein NQ317_013786 [Molorchus minor]|uniref:Uncharacterized protein n=1 Tax=Molorchus minor TaxID=1323400 RepID=A0ABQ9IXH6_9CUCU|nr:hypothetical protein NQ317_013786 [Molorchus minor]